MRIIDWRLDMCSSHIKKRKKKNIKRKKKFKNEKKNMKKASRSIERLLFLKKKNRVTLLFN
jgi:hypothetical protein